MDNITSRDKNEQILTNLKTMYLMIIDSYLYSHLLSHKMTYFLDCCTERLIKRNFNMLLTLSSKCNLEKDIQLILYNIYKRNLDVETQDYMVSRHNFLNAMSDVLENNTVFELPPIPEEQRWVCFQPPLVDYPQQRFCSYLVKPKQD